MDTFSVPFRFDQTTGRAATHAENTESYYMHILSMVLLTQPGEMPLDVNFGINDPVFERISRPSIVEIASKYVPEVRIENVGTVLAEDGTEQLIIQYRI